MLKVKTFLGCFKLETGGQIIGWLNAFYYICAILIWAIALTFVVTDCDGLKNFIKRYYRGDLSSYCLSGNGDVIVNFAFAMVFSICFFIITCFFIKGLNRRDRTYVKPMMSLLGFSTVSSLFNYVLPFFTFGTSLTLTIIYGYEFVVVYSIHSKFSDEFSEASPVSQSEIAKV